MRNDDTSNDDDTNIEHPPSLSEAIIMVRRLHLLSTTQYPELHLFVTQLQSKLIDIYLDSNCSKQLSIRDFFKPIGLGGLYGNASSDPQLRIINYIRMLLKDLKYDLIRSIAQIFQQVVDNQEHKDAFEYDVYEFRLVIEKRALQENEEIEAIKSLT
ncbi:unnamed protein product [Rotaria sp. Silwood2]|nr:unnamed protein product [Rotaria sp. Silwood2]CAF3457762.1 unnamed protein product [Rotaria sp. Silwood2]CAF4529986.1 unnamed protein product [Rotaria sp. Silwood2]